jgi:hypothetical protein
MNAFLFGGGVPWRGRYKPNLRFLLNCIHLVGRLDSNRKSKEYFALSSAGEQRW